MRLGFLLKRGKPEARQIAGELAALVRQRGGEAVIGAEEEGDWPGTVRVPSQLLGKSIDVLVVLGGDGTFLHGAALVADDGVPLLGINLGSLGFMTPYALPEAHEAIEAVVEGRLPIDQRMRLKVQVRSGGVVVESRTALNEAAITQRLLARLLDLSVELDGSMITTLKADGIIVSTPTGSTAYSLAAGGPILTPDLEAIALTPICPHTLTNRPVALRADGKLVITNTSPYGVMLTVDGQWSRELGPGEGIEVTKAERPLRMFRGQRSFFAALRQKLRWGEREG